MLSLTLNSTFLALCFAFQPSAEPPVIITLPPLPPPAFYELELIDDPTEAVRENWYPPVMGLRYNGTVPSWKNPVTFSYVPPALRGGGKRVLIFNPYASERAHRNVAARFVLP